MATSTTLRRARSRAAQLIRHTMLALALGTAIATGLTGCGEDQPAVTDPAQLQQAVSLNYMRGNNPDEVREIPVTLGKIVSVQVTSEVAGEVRIDGLNVSGQVPAGGSTVLIFSADNPGDFDVGLRGDDVDVRLAQLVIGAE